MKTLSILTGGRQLASCVLGLGVLLAIADVSLAQGPGAEEPPSPQKTAAPLPIDLTGSWAGHWEDCRSGHCGKLWAVFCRCDDCHYLVTFTGRFFRIFPFRYTVVLNAQQEGDRVVLMGENNLGALFGTFTYRGTATATDFFANYSSCRYQGVFVLSRCCCP
jgi:hypothetical protein